MNGTIKEISETKTVNLVVGKILTEKVVLPYVSLFIDKYPYIINAKGATTHEYAKDLFKKYDLNITPSMEVLGTSLITNFVKEGLGISILTKEFIKEELNNKELFEIKVKEELESRNLSIIYHKNNNLPKEVQYFINILSNIDIEEKTAKK